MSNYLTRIKNNQITDSTILANVKVVPGSIVGSLFNSNLTMTSDVTITGNLTVQGSSTYLTVASTNTYVNDPLIVLNNAFSGTNSNDIGLLYNRGDQATAALIWREANDEFRLIYTTDPGTGTGTIAQTGYANIRLGNLNVNRHSNLNTVSVDNWIYAGNVDLSGNLGVNGNALTSNVATFDLLDSSVTTLNAFGAATTIDLGATSGTLTINNPTVVGTQSTQNLYNTTATTLNFAGAATTINIGATGGSIEARGNINAAATGLFNKGSDGEVLINPSSIEIGTFNRSVAGPAFIDLHSSATNTDFDVRFIATDGTSTAGSGNLDVYASTSVFHGNINSTENVTVDKDLTVTQDLAVNGGDLTTTASTFNLLNTGATTLNVGGAATTLVVGATTGAANLRNATTNIIGNATVGKELTVTGNVNIDAVTQSTNTTSGALIVDGGVGIAKNLNVGGDVVVTGNLTVNGDVTTVNTATLDVEDLNITVAKGAASSAAADGAGLTVDGAGATILYTHATTSWNLNKHLIGTSAQFSSTLGVTGDTTLTANLAVNGGALTTTAGTFDLLDSTATTVNAFGAATIIDLGATSGTLTINNPTVVGSQTTQAVFNTTATTVNAFGAATALTLGATTGNATIRNANTIVTGNAVISSAIDSNSPTTGALTVAGGVGIAKKLNVGGNVNISGNHILTLGADLVGGTVSDSHIAAFTSNANVNSRVSIKNISTGTEARTEYIAIADVGNDSYAHLRMGIVNSGTDVSQVTKNIDSYLFSHASNTNVGGNLVVGSLTNNDINFVVGGQTNNDRVARITHSTHSLDVLSSTNSTSTSTGALTVVGGVGIGANVYVANGAVINSSQSSENFVVKGRNTTSLIVADSTYGAVVIGGSNASPQLGATLKINSADSIMVPVGSTADRPSNTGNVDVAGMIRYNTSINALEFYTGADWSAAGSSSTFTIIRDQQFNGDGANVAYTLTYATNTNSCLVSINGILQLPIVSYSLGGGGTTLTFTEAPAEGDVIDVRSLSTTQTIGELSSTNGFNTVNPDNTLGVAVYTGIDAPSKTLRVAVEPNGAFAFKNGTKTSYDQTVTNISSASAPFIIDTFPVADYSSAKYVVQTKNGANIEAMEALVVGTSTDAHITTYGVVNAGTALGTLSANVVGGNVRLYYTSTSLTNSNVKVYTTYIV